MTCKEAIDFADQVAPNALSDELKYQFLNEAEGAVQTGVLLLSQVETVKYTPSRPNDVLLADPPHDKLYWQYVTAMIHFANADYDRYQNTMQMYNESLAEFMRWYAQNFRPADR